MSEPLDRAMQFAGHILNYARVREMRSEGIYGPLMAVALMAEMIDVRTDDLVAALRSCRNRARPIVAENLVGLLMRRAHRQEEEEGTAHLKLPCPRCDRYACTCPASARPS